MGPVFSHFCPRYKPITVLSWSVHVACCTLQNHLHMAPTTQEESGVFVCGPLAALQGLC